MGSPWCSSRIVSVSRQIQTWRWQIGIKIERPFRKFYRPLPHPKFIFFDKRGQDFFDKGEVWGVLVIEFKHLSKDGWLAVRCKIDTPPTWDKVTPESQEGRRWLWRKKRVISMTDLRGKGKWTLIIGTYSVINDARLRMSIRLLVCMSPSNRASKIQ